MKLHVLNLMAIVGAVIIIGSVGTMDYMAAIGQSYSVTELLKTLLCGFLMIVPRFVCED